MVAALGMAAGAAVTLPAAAQVVASDGWIEAPAPGATTANAYLVLRNTGDEEQSLLRIASPLADQITLHQRSTDAEGKPRLWPLSGLSLEGGQTVRFEPGGRLLILRQIKGPFEPGRQVPVALRFDHGQPEFTVMLEVRAASPAAGGARR